MYKSSEDLFKNRNNEKEEIKRKRGNKKKNINHKARKQ